MKKFKRPKVKTGKKAKAELKADAKGHKKVNQKKKSTTRKMIKRTLKPFKSKK